MPDVLSLAQSLIRCPSVTPEDGGALALLADVLSAAGFEVHAPVFSQAGFPDVRNLYARIGEGRPCLAFAGHTDVVPAGDVSRWRHDPFGGTVEDGVLYGRGAADMKGGVAAMVAAAVAFTAGLSGPPPGAIAFLLTGDEEGPAVNGTVKLLDWAKAQGEVFDHCVLGEPTNPDRLGGMMKIGRRGSLTGRLTVRGRQGHVAYPHLAANPIPGLARLVTALAVNPVDAGTERFDPSSLQFSTVDVGNPASNVIPAEARAVFNIRFNDLWTPETLAAEIRRRLDAAGTAASSGLAFDLAFDPTNAVAFVTEPGGFVDLLADAIREETGLSPELSTTGGTSDARFIKDHCPVVEFGLVGRTMHAVDECVPVADLEALARIYGGFLRRYFASAA